MNPSAITSRYQTGVTLIELMIAVVLSLFVLGAMLSLFIGNRQAYRAQDAAARLQDSARFALELLNREARKTGYRAAFTTAAQAFPAAETFAAGQVAFGTDQSLTLRYQGSGTGSGDGWMQDCLGRNLAEGDLAGVTLSVNGQSELICTSDNATAGDDPVTQPLIGGVESMLFTYGEDTNGDSYADAYVDAAGVTDWTQIISIRIDLLLVTEEDGLVDSPVPYSWGGAMVTPGDRRMRRVHSNVIGLRNTLQ